MRHTRKYNAKKDRSAVHRIFREVGWIEKGKEKIIDVFLRANNALVIDVQREAECLASTCFGSMRYLDEELDFSGVTAVVTSRIARKMGLAKRVTSAAIAADAEKGALVSGLGIFEQGFYNMLGYGSMGYEHVHAFDPANLNIETKCRIPSRISEKKWRAVHASRLNRMRKHGSISFEPAGITRAEMMWSKNGFGLGYHDGPEGALSHHMWFSVKDPEQGPYNVRWLIYQNREQFLELLAAIKSLGDQVRMVRILEPPGTQVQDFLQQPFRFQQLTERSKFENRIEALAWQQVRMCDVVACMAKTRLENEASFNLELSDPIEGYLDEKSLWRGVGGDYIVRIGKESSAEKGKDRSLPTLKASVGAFTRLWLGVSQASGLAFTDRISGPRGLIEQLDRTFHLPQPKLDWDF
jgi:hypothetical protein